MTTTLLHRTIATTILVLVWTRSTHGAQDLWATGVVHRLVPEIQGESAEALALAVVAEVATSLAGRAACCLPAGQGVRPLHGPRPPGSRLELRRDGRAGVHHAPG